MSYCHRIVLIAVFVLGATSAFGVEPTLGPMDGSDLPAEDLERVAVGAPAPDFVLEDHLGKPVRLSQYRADRPVALVFYRGKW